MLQLLAWADDNLIALGCADVCDDEFRNGLVLVSVDGERSTRLSPNVASDGPDDWHWLLTPR
ncbi:hypothetical protein [Nonomuraea sp. NPDC046570]|uniref:hypothetical protein n=1 Tax=Nonomuraea sp. NPDC046570 TaxID=3155255 RepID=UPI0033FD80C5